MIVVAALGGTSEVKINPKVAPVVFEGGSFKFIANRPVDWSLAPGSKGSIDADGTYHAPTHISVNQSVGGCQVLPNNHVLNARIDGLPIHPKSKQWMNAANGLGGVLSTGRLHYSMSFPINLITSETPTQKMVFAYTPAANGPFHILPAADLKMESGYYSEQFSNLDRHSIMLETDTCNLQEMYNLYAVGTNTYNNCPMCTSQAGVRYSGSSYRLPKAATDAASLYLTPLSLHRDEILSGSIHHALRFTLAGSYIQASHIWPAMADAGYNHGDLPPFGSRFRLRSNFAFESRNPYVKTLITQLKQYGLLLADIGGQWEIDNSDVDLYLDPQIRAAIKEVSGAVEPANFEIIDESSLMTSADSGDTPVDAETVVAKDKATGAAGSMRVVLVGVTIGADAQYVVMQAGAPPFKLRTWVNGSSNQKATWRMNPSIGTLSSEGVYTPPAQLADQKELVLTARANADDQAMTSTRVILLPAGPIRIDNGSPAVTTDSSGSKWAAECCTPFAVTYDYSNFSWPASKDIKLYQNDTVSWTDIGYRFYMPPGKYRVTAKLAEPTNTRTSVRIMHLESQGQLIYQDIDLFAQAGVRNPIDFDLPAEVGSDGKLDFVVRHVKGEQALLSALQILPDAGIPRLQVWPPSGGTLPILKSKKFHSVAWYMSNKGILWSISPKLGSIDTDGLYTAPAVPAAQDTVVTVTATSSANPTVSAKSSFTIAKGIPVIRVSCGGGEFIDAQKNVWSSDYGFEGGVNYAGVFPIRGAPQDMQKLYQASRYGYGTDSFSYSFPLPNGTYRVTLKWAEYRTAQEVSSQHMLYKMSVTINGQPALDNFDPIAAAGGVLIAYDRTFSAKVTNGNIKIVFKGLPGSQYVGAAINGIEIEPVQ